MKESKLGTRAEENTLGDERLKALEAWITKRGYPLETRTALTLSSAGFYVSRGTLYLDPKTKLTREVDVLASRFFRLDRRSPMIELSIQVSLVVECKHVERHSWVLFSQPADRLMEHHPLDLLTNRLGDRFLDNLSKALDPPRLSVLMGFERAGYDLRAGPTEKKDDPDEAHAAYAQVLSAARARAGIWGDFEPIGHADLVMPVIVLDGPLYECVPGPGEKPAISAIERGILRTQSWDTRLPETIIHVVTIGALLKFASLCFQDAGMLMSRKIELLKAQQALAGS